MFLLYFGLVEPIHAAIVVPLIIAVAAYITSWLAFFALPQSIAIPGLETSSSVSERMFAYVTAWLSGNSGLLRGYNEVRCVQTVPLAFIIYRHPNSTASRESHSSYPALP
jgi:hypothetical protein